MRGPARDFAVNFSILEELVGYPVHGSSVRDVGVARRIVVEDEVVPRTQVGVHLEPIEVLNVGTVQSFVSGTSVPFGIVVGLPTHSRVAST